MAASFTAHNQLPFFYENKTIMKVNVYPNESIFPRVYFCHNKLNSVLVIYVFLLLLNYKMK